MISCNLAVLLAERGLKISTVAKDTGISRTTLTSLANNNSQGLQFETLDKLLIYLDAQPNQFFIFQPFSIRCTMEKPYVAVEITRDLQVHRVLMRYSIKEKEDEIYGYAIPARLLFWADEKGEETFEKPEVSDVDWFKEYYRSLPRNFRDVIVNSVKEVVLQSDEAKALGISDFRFKFFQM